MRDLNGMAVFAQVAQSGSFSAASRQLAMPLSTVSRKVSELESDLGVKLLERSTRSLRLTEIGATYLDHCQRGLEAFNTANLLIEDYQSEVAGVLRISLPPSIAESLFVPIVGLFQQRYPKARVAVFITERLTDRVDDSIDLAFRVGPVARTSLRAERLLRYRHKLIASPAYLGENGTPEDPSDLRKHRLIAFGFWRETNKQWTLSNGKRTEAITLEPDLSFNDYSAILSAVIAGQGLAEVPSILCSDALVQGVIIEALSKWRFSDTELRAVHPGKQNMSRLMRLFLDTCTEYINARTEPNQ